MSMIGTTAEMYATWRHEMNEPSKNIIKIPQVVEMPENALKTPRSDGSLWKTVISVNSSMLSPSQSCQSKLFTLFHWYK